MEIRTPAQLERAEVELVLQSGLFAKAPRLEKFFRYICERQLEGQGDQVKEYSVAVEALGRPADFDPKKDSIVRVEAHRLRKRLEEYYRGVGFDHPVTISIPNGQYRPHFTSRAAILALSPDPPHVPPVDFSTVEIARVEPAVPSVSATPAASRTWIWPVLYLISALVVVALLLLWRRLPIKLTEAPSAQSEIWTLPASGFTIPGEIRMLAGYHGPPILDRQGRSWTADAYYRGGASSAVATGRQIDPESDALLARTERSGTFQYDIPLRNCSYEMHLYVAETEFGRGNPSGGAESTRLFGISINGQPTLDNFDPLAEAGAPNRLYERVFKDIRPAADRRLHLAFQSGSAPAFLNAIKLVPSAAGRIHPVRIVAQSNPVTDSDGRLWAADEYFFGGHTVTRANVVASSQEELYQGERYGNFSYRIPLAPGKYRLTLYFAETWFGIGSIEPALNSRIFNVFANGVALLREYQIAQDAGGPNRGVEKVFNDLEPNAQGMLVLDFVPLRNYAAINAIEVVETD